MADYSHPDGLGSFSLPDRPTVRQVLRYDEAIERGLGKTEDFAIYERIWPAVCRVAQNWTSEILPLDPEYLDSEGAKENAFSLLKWACLVTFQHMRDVREVEKN